VARISYFEEPEDLNLLEEEDTNSQFAEFLQPDIRSEDRLWEAVLAEARISEEHVSFHYYFEEAISYPFNAIWKPLLPNQRVEIPIEVLSAEGFEDTRGEQLRVKIKEKLSATTSLHVGLVLSIPAYQVYSKGTFSSIVLHDNREYMKNSLLVNSGKLHAVTDDVDALSYSNFNEEFDDCHDDDFNEACAEIKKRYKTETSKPYTNPDFKAVVRVADSDKRSDALMGGLTNMCRDLYVLFQYVEQTLPFPFEAKWKSTIEQLPAVNVVITGAKMSPYYGIVFQVQGGNMVPAEELAIRSKEQRDATTIENVLTDYNLWLTHSTVNRMSMINSLLTDLATMLEHGGYKSYAY